MRYPYSSDREQRENVINVSRLFWLNAGVMFAIDFPIVLLSKVDAMQSAPYNANPQVIKIELHALLGS